VKVVQVVGESESGKTTAIVALISHFIANAATVGAIKHTHHPINEEDRGDTAVFRRAGAEPVVLAGNGEAIVFYGDAKARITYDNARELLDRFRNDIVFVEGFKSVGEWPRIELSKDQRRTTEELLKILDRIWRP
jgi:molybdopterin-guanine dinucleotide biosynthesis adapter protein